MRMKFRKASERDSTCSIDRVEPMGISGSTSVNASRTARVRLSGSIALAGCAFAAATRTTTVRGNHPSKS